MRFLHVVFARFQFHIAVFDNGVTDGGISVSLQTHRSGIHDSRTADRHRKLHVRMPDEHKIGNLTEFDGWAMQNSEGELVEYADFPLVRAMTANTTTLNIDLRVGKFGGDWIETGVSAAPLRGVDGATMGGVLVMQDLSSMRHAERRALDQEDRLQLLESAVVNARDAVVILDAVSCPNRGRPVRYVNMAFTQITGYTAEEVVGRSLHLLRGPKTDTNTLDAVRTALDTCGTFRGEVLNYSKSGEEIWVSLSLVPVWGANGRVGPIERDPGEYRAIRVCFGSG